MNRFEVTALNFGLPGRAFANERAALIWAERQYQQYGPRLDLEMSWNGWRYLGRAQMRWLYR